jgi:ParB-like chromosome segregation protein Spo0J
MPTEETTPLGVDVPLPGETTAAPVQLELFDLKLTVKFSSVALELLTPNEGLPGEPSADLIASLASLGLLTPIIVQELPKAEGAVYTHFRVLDGARRLKAARQLLADDTLKLSSKRLKELRLSPIPCAVVPAGFASGPVVTLVTNYLRGDNPVRDFAALEELLKKPGSTPESIAQALHLPAKEVQRLTRLLALRPLLREAFLAGQIKPGVARRLAKWPQDRQKTVEAQLVALGTVTGPDLDALMSAGSAAAVAALPGSLFSGPGAELLGSAAPTPPEADPFTPEPSPASPPSGEAASDLAHAALQHPAVIAMAEKLEAEKAAAVKELQLAKQEIQLANTEAEADAKLIQEIKGSILQVKQDAETYAQTINGLKAVNQNAANVIAQLEAEKAQLTVQLQDTTGELKDTLVKLNNLKTQHAQAAAQRDQAQKQVGILSKRTVAVTQLLLNTPASKVTKAMLTEWAQILEGSKDV